MATYKPSENVVFTSLFDGTGVLLDLRTKLYYTLNETGRLIWEQLDRGLGPEEIAKRLSEEYDVSPEEALREDLHAPPDHASPRPRSGGATGGVCKEQGRIHRGLVTRGY